MIKTILAVIGVLTLIIIIAFALAVLVTLWEDRKNED